MIAHERTGDADQRIGHVACAGGFGNLAAKPTATPPIEENTDNDADDDQQDERHERGCDEGHFG